MYLRVGFCSYASKTIVTCSEEKSTCFLSKSKLVKVVFLLSKLTRAVTWLGSMVQEIRSLVNVVLLASAFNIFSATRPVAALLNSCIFSSLSADFGLWNRSGSKLRKDTSFFGKELFLTLTT